MASQSDNPGIAGESTLLELLGLLLDREDYGVALHVSEEDDFRYIYVNPAYQALSPTVQMAGRLVSEVWPHAATDMLPRLAEVQRTGLPWTRFNQEIRIHAEDGSVSSRYFTLRLLRLELGGQVYVATTSYDVTPEMEAARVAAAAQRDLKRSASLIRWHEHEARVLQGANHILEGAITAESEHELGQLSLQIAEQITGSAFGFIGLLNEDGTMADVAISNPGWEACSQWDQEGHRRAPFQSGAVGLYARPLASGETFFTNDPAHHPAQSGTPEGHPPLSSFLGVPLKRRGKTVGIVAVANREGGYGREEVRLLEELAPSISTAIYSYRSASSLLESTQLLQAHMNNSPLAVVEFDMAFKISRWSASAERVFGWTADEVLGRPLWDVPWVYGADTQNVQAESSRLHAGAVLSSKNVNRNVRKDGRVIWCEWYSSVIQDEHGEMRSVFSLVQDITEQKQTEERLELQARRVASLKHIADVAASALEVNELGERMSAAIAEVAGSDVVALARTDEDRGISVLSTWGISDEFFKARVASGAVDRLGSPWRLSGPVYLADLRAGSLDGAAVREFEDLGIVSIAWVPLAVEGKPTGGIGLGWRTRHEFDEDQIAFLESLTSEIAVGLQNAMLFESERARRRRIQQLHGVLEVAVASLEPAEAAQSILGYLAERKTFDIANVWITRGDALELIACINYPYAYRERYSPMPLTATYDAAKVYHTGESIVAASPSAMQQAVRDMYQSIGVKLGAYAIVPLRARGRTVGTLNLAWHEPRSISASDIAFYESIGSELGVVLENAELMRGRTLQARYAEALNRINDAVHSTLDIDEIMRRVVVDAAEAVGWDAAAIHLREAGQWRLAYTYGVRDELRELRLSDEEAALSAEVLRQGETLMVAEGKNDTEANREFIERFGMGAALALPIVARGERVGVLITGIFGSEASFDERQIDFMQKVASTVSLALENARLYQAEHTIADRLQGALLTLPERIPGVRFAHAYHSATEAARVGGDFYDLFEIGENSVGIVIGDVAGKGIDAAVLTSLVKNTLRAHAAAPGVSPARILELTNDVVYRSTPVEAFVTVFFGVLDTGDGALEYASAGHTDGALVRLGELPSALHVTGPLLGAFPHVRFDQASARVAIGDMLFLYTDGLIEARHGNELFGEERLRETLAVAEHASPEQLVSEIVGEVVAFADGHLTDDLAILVVQLVEPENVPRQQRLEV